MTIIHISTDYPDSFNPNKTRAIANMVEATSDQFKHYVYSLNRCDLSIVKGVASWVMGNSATCARNLDDVGIVSTWTYDAPSRGILLKTALEAIADNLAQDIVAKGLRPSMFQGHKLSMEGIIAERLARHFDVPYALTIQGNSDRAILQVRRDLWSLYAHIFQGAEMVFPFTPWALDYCANTLGARKKPVMILPCITRNDHIIAPNDSAKDMISAFHLRHWKIKNFDVLAKASYLSSLPKPVKGHDGTLTIYGGGDDDVQRHLSSKASILGKGTVRFGGALSGEALKQRMNDSALFAMVSKRESFGMVFIEALLAGCPVLYPANTAIDGYFNNESFAQSVPANDAAAIAAGMRDMLASQSAIKRDLKLWQESGGAIAFQRETIIANYSAGLKLALKGKV